jgi:hypothetical protein
MTQSTQRWPAHVRVPRFVPVPLRARADGWTAERQARFVGLLAETGSVAAAARAVGMSRMTAYRLRGRFGAGSFAHAWDTIVAARAGVSPCSPDYPKRKVTPDELAEHAHEGAFHVVMHGGRFVRAVRKPSNSALLRHLRRLDAAAARGGWED